MTEDSDHILLKWGTLKGYYISFTNTAACAILNELLASPRCVSAALQQDTPHEKELLLRLIEAHEGPIINDWSGETMTKEQANEYIINYGKQSDGA